MIDIQTLKTFEIVLTDRIAQQILIPPNCANGHLCLTPECIFQYKQTSYYGTKQFTVKWNDPVVTKTVKWYGITNPTLSQRDSEGPFYDFGQSSVQV